MNLTTLQNLYIKRVPGETICNTLQRLKENQVLDSEIDVSYDEELSIPRMKIVQPSSRIEGATEGCYRNMLTGEEFGELDLVFLVQQNSRTLFPQNDFSGNKRCFSFNGYFPSGDVKERTGQPAISSQCATRENGKVKFICPMAQWLNELGEPDVNGRVQPKCKPTISMLAVIQNTLIPCWLTFYGSAIPEIKSFLTFFKYKREEMKRQRVSLNLYDFQIKLKLELVTNSRGKFYVPKLIEKKLITNEKEKELLSRCYNEFKDRLLTDPVEIE